MKSSKIQGSMDVLNSFRMTEETAGLDQASKEVCKNREVLAIILKGVVKEYADYSCGEIMEFIEGESITDEKCVTPGLTNTRIRGDGKEFAVLNEKLSNFDTAFTAINPKLSDREIQVRLHIDIEPQQTYRPGYPIEKRGIYYLAREFSSQLNLIADGTDYNRLEKCYSIWICRDDIPNDEKFSISIFNITNAENYGNCHSNLTDYDLLTLVIIRLGDAIYRHMDDRDKDNMMEFIHAIMYPHRNDFMETVKKHIDFSDSEKLWEEMHTMSGLGESILKEGREEGMSLLGTLMQKLLADRRVEDAQKASNDKSYRDQLLAEYGLTR